ncbi:uncharacterized protein G2W53_040746 [Senna tora]|uniref:Uncharacterized protein n=1 Tax=Senna tora TaxID=362788 RepID=A0A834VYR2_9FABA|nr:uncharacterized protein G2W53_040746 [Senna tora]
MKEIFDVEASIVLGGRFSVGFTSCSLVLVFEDSSRFTACNGVRRWLPKVAVDNGYGQRWSTVALRDDGAALCDDGAIFFSFKFRDFDAQIGEDKMTMRVRKFLYKNGSCLIENDDLALQADRVEGVMLTNNMTLAQLKQSIRDTLKMGRGEEICKCDITNTNDAVSVAILGA